MRLLPLLSTLFSLAAASFPLVIKTTSGHVRGFSPSNGVTAYLGVPYASPPTGPLRFHPPHPSEFGREIINATAYSYSCYQFQYKLQNGSDDSAAFPRDRQNEDCLYLNIWTPAGAEKKKKKKKISTMLWLHGGSWVGGTASTDLYSGEYLVSNNPDVIVVTINYRLGIFGYPYSPLLTRNLGLLDQRFAIEWTHKNIAAFGGDPDKITLFGESAGSGSISTYAYAYPHNPLVRAFIMQSGTAELISDPGPGEFLRVAGNVGCKDGEEERVKCMMAAEAGKIQDAVSPRLLNGARDGSGGVPGVDNVTAFSPEEVVKRGLAGKFARLPTLMGTNYHEADILVPYSPSTGINYTLSDYFTSLLFTCPTAKQSRYRTLNHVPIYRYRYMPRFPSVTPYPWLRSAYHSSELPLLFGTWKAWKAWGVQNNTEREERASRELMRMWTAFIKDPTEGLEKRGWRRYSEKGETLVEIFPNEEVTVKLVESGMFDKGCESLPTVNLLGIFYQNGTRS
ncbi:Alpha/Beta hydrolase protein [Trichophaea hybrida]|nr:Alpha/Beta hydrolase protein [Trichophaea hybrida]